MIRVDHLPTSDKKAVLPRPTPPCDVPAAEPGSGAVSTFQDRMREGMPSPPGVAVIFSQSKHLLLMGMLPWLEVHASWGTPPYRPWQLFLREIAASMHAQGCLAGEQLTAAKGQVGGLFFLIGCFARLLVLKPLLIRFPLWANVKGHLFHHEAGQPHQWQNSQAGSRQASLTEGTVWHSYHTA